MPKRVFIQAQENGFPSVGGIKRRMLCLDGRIGQEDTDINSQGTGKGEVKRDSMADSIGAKVYTMAKSMTDSITKANGKIHEVLTKNIRRSKANVHSIHVNGEGRNTVAGI